MITQPKLSEKPQAGQAEVREAGEVLMPNQGRARVGVRLGEGDDI